MKTSDERINSINSKVKSKRRQRAIVWTSTVTACVLVALTVVCSLPIFGGNDAPPITAYENDEYYPIIQKINAQYASDKYSIFQQWYSDLNIAQGDGPATAPPTSSAESNSPTNPDASNDSSNNNKYEETTLNQVDGVTEGDLLKRSSTHAFYIKNGYSKNAEPCLLLQVYKLAGSDTQAVAECFIRAKDETSFSRYQSYINCEMFLNADATRLTVITTCLSKQNIVYTTVISLDVSDVQNVTEVNRVYVSGSYLSSRKVDGKLLVITNFSAGNYGSYGYEQINYDKKETYVPQCGSTLGGDFVRIGNIHIPDKCPSICYTVLALLDETTLKVSDSYAVFSYAQDVYVSRDYLVVMRNAAYCYKEQVEYGNEVDLNDAYAKDDDNKYFSLYATLREGYLSARIAEMVALKYKDGFEKIGEIGLDGYVKDRYSMDEKDGILRVFVTSTRSNAISKYSDLWFASNSNTNVSLYCVSLSEMKVVASKVNFAPTGDEVKSARFEGNAAYVCTARRNTDPVFYFDLSDLNNITYVDTGEIEGFSVNLIKFNDLLLGIGQGQNSLTLKVELYRETDDPDAENGVVGVAVYERECRFSFEYKAHFADAEHKLIGLQIYDYDKLVTDNPNALHNKYLLLRYDEESNTLQTVYLEEFDGHYDYTRAFYEHDGVYVFGTNAFTFIDLNN